MSASHQKERLTWSWCIFWATLFLLTCLHTGLIIFHHVPLDVNEGWNAQLASRASTMAGEYGLYSSQDGFVFNNYPPLSFILMGGLVRLGCDAIIAGRILSCLSVLVAACLIVRVIQTLTRKLPAAFAVAALFLVTANTAFYGYFGMNDPQWMAQALMLGGLCVLLGRGGADLTIRRLFLSACLIVLGGFIKHNLVALPLAMAIWLFFVSPKKAVIWGLMVSGLLLVGFAACYDVYGISFFQNIFLHQRVVRLGRSIHALRELPLMGGILLVGIWLFCQRWKAMSLRDPAVLVMLFLILGCLLGVLESMGEGVDYNCVFDAFVAGTLACGLGLASLLSEEGHTASLKRACWVLTVPLLVLVPVRGVDFYKEIQSVTLKEQVWQTYIVALKGHSSSLLCTDMALCYWAHGHETVDRFNLSQALKKNKNIIYLRNQIDQHRFSLVQLYGTFDHYSSGNIIFDSWLQKAGYRPVSDSGQMILLGYGH